MKTKKCTKCGEEKPATREFFYKAKGCLDGLRPICKICVNNNFKASSTYKNKKKYKDLSHEEKHMLKIRKQIYKEKQDSGIYKITNLINNRIYIGQTQFFDERKTRHKMKLKQNRHVNSKLQEDYNLYGENAFEWSMLKILPRDEDILLFEEKRTISKLLDEGQELYNLNSIFFNDENVKIVSDLRKEGYSLRKISNITELPVYQVICILRHKN